MRLHQTFYITIVALALVIALYGCATPSAEQSTVTNVSANSTAPGPGMLKTTDLVFQYRQQAAELRDMARRLETEALVYAQRKEPDQAKRSLELAKDMRTAADTADERAREYRRQVPHGQVY